MLIFLSVVLILIENIEMLPSKFHSHKGKSKYRDLNLWLPGKSPLYPTYGPEPGYMKNKHPWLKHFDNNKEYLTPAAYPNSITRYKKHKRTGRRKIFDKTNFDPSLYYKPFSEEDYLEDARNSIGPLFNDNGAETVHRTHFKNRIPTYYAKLQHGKLKPKISPRNASQPKDMLGDDVFDVDYDDSMTGNSDHFNSESQQGVAIFSTEAGAPSQLPVPSTVNTGQQLYRGQPFPTTEQKVGDVSQLKPPLSAAEHGKSPAQGHAKNTPGDVYGHAMDDMFEQGTAPQEQTGNGRPFVPNILPISNKPLPVPLPTSSAAHRQHWITSEGGNGVTPSNIFQDTRLNIPGGTPYGRPPPFGTARNETLPEKQWNSATVGSDSGKHLYNNLASSASGSSKKSNSTSVSQTSYFYRKLKEAKSFHDKFSKKEKIFAATTAAFLASVAVFLIVLMLYKHYAEKRRRKYPFKEKNTFTLLRATKKRKKDLLDRIARMKFGGERAEESLG